MIMFIMFVYVCIHSFIHFHVVNIINVYSVVNIFASAVK